MESSGATTTTPGRKIMVASSPTTAPTQAGSYSQGLTDDNSSNKRKRTESTNGTTNNNNSRNNSIASRKNKTNATSSPAASASASAAAAAAAVTIKAAERTTFDSFWGQGRPKENGMRVEYDGFNVNIGRDLYEIAVGDAVMLRTYNPNANPNGAAVSASGSAGDNDYKADDASSDNPSDYYKSSGGGGGGGGGNGGTPGAGVGGGGMTMIQHRDPKTGDNLMLARVEKVWQEKGRSGKPGQVLFQARWLLKIDDVRSLPLDAVSGPASADEMMSLITEHDVVLSNQCDNNHVTTICGLIQVLYRRPDADKNGLPSHILPSTYLCRYSITIKERDDGDIELFLVPYSGSNDDWGEMTIGAINPPTATHIENKMEVRVREEKHQDSMDTALTRNVAGNFGAGTTTTTTDDSESEMSQFEARSKKQRRDDNLTEEMSVLEEETIDEGTTEQRDIRVGNAHQVYVPPFEGPRPSISRNPQCVWKRGAASQDVIDEYMEKVTSILNPILRRNAWTQEDPHVPFPISRLEKISKSLDNDQLPTLSSISTSSSLSSKIIDTDGPLREFDCDALMQNLYAFDCNIPKALSRVKHSPQVFLAVWDRNQTALFNSGFRRFAGSLRATLKPLKPEKTLNDVIDYHYRFKIPHMFSRFQDRKREQAVRMLECIETRRSLDTPILVPASQEPGSSASQGTKKISTGGDKEITNGHDWSKMSVPSMAISVEERRRRAKELLLDIDAKLGKHKLMEVCKMMESWEELSFLEAKTKLLHITRGYPDLQSRALEFFPNSQRI